MNLMEVLNEIQEKYVHIITGVACVKVKKSFLKNHLVGGSFFYEIASFNLNLIVPFDTLFKKEVYNYKESFSAEINGMRLSIIPDYID